MAASLTADFVEGVYVCCAILMAASFSGIILFTLITITLHLPFFSIQEYDDLKMVAKEIRFPQPVVIVRGEGTRNVKDGHIAIEGSILCKLYN